MLDSGYRTAQPLPFTDAAWQDTVVSGEEDSEAAGEDVTVIRKEGRGGRFAIAAFPASQGLFAQNPLFLLSDTVRHVFAGTTARTMAQAFIHPIDTIKTRLQVRSPLQKLENWRVKTRTKFFDLHLGSKRVVHARNFAHKGPKDLYLGLSGAVLGTIPTALTYFITYEWCKRRLEERRTNKELVHLASASSGAVVSAVFFRVPADTLKHRVQVYLHKNVFEAARHIIRHEGFCGLYTGMLPTLLRDVPEIAIQFTLYERLRRTIEQRRGVEKLRTWEHLVLGGFSGAVAASMTMPLDLVKTTLQCGANMPIPKVLSLTMREQGMGGLFAGMGPRVSQTAIMSAVFFTLFEFWKSQLKRDRVHNDSLLRPKLWRKRRPHVWKRQFVYN